MGGIFSSGKRAAPVEAESAASHPAAPTTNRDSNHGLSSAAQPPLKRRRIEPHNDPITPLYVPASIPTKEVNQDTQQYSRSPIGGSANFLSNHNANPSVHQNNRPTTTSKHGSRNIRVVEQKYYSSETGNLNAAASSRRHLKKRRCAILMGFNGANYHGMQLNVGVPTIEELLMRALHKADMISDHNQMQPAKISLMRSARTDKGVSAAAQVVSVKLELTDEQLSNMSIAVNLINTFLPNDIRVYDLLRVTSAFNARQDCHKRRYEYIFPLHLLGGANTVKADGKDGQDARVHKLSAILKQYEGTHCFANFTDGLKINEDAARRFMISVKCLPPFRPPGTAFYYVTIEVIGQSFLLHQIRRMVGLALLIYHDHLPAESIAVALCGQVKFATPRAPAEGLLLDTLYFDQYNRRFANSIPQKVSDEHIAGRKREFKSEMIYRQIAEREAQGQALEQWILQCKGHTRLAKSEVLNLHELHVRTDAGKRQLRDQYVASLYRIRTSVEEFLDCGSHDQSRQLVENVRNKFKYRYGTSPTFMVRAPGRVIIIGEHLDYNCLPVVSVALKQGTVIAGSFNDGKHVDIAHLEDSVYRPGSMNVDGKLENELDGQESSGHEGIQSDEDDRRDNRWLRYVACGVKALAKYLEYKRTVSGGGRILIGGDLPRAGGLASSSSLVSASVLAGARLSRRRLPRPDLATAAAEGERGGVRTCGGSVDHVTSFCAEKGYALHVSFVPELQVKHVKWPREAKLFAVNSGTVAEKGGNESVRFKFNLRVAECRIGTAIVAQRLKLQNAEAIATPGQLLFSSCRIASLKCDNVQQMTELAKSVVKRDECISIEAAEELLQLDSAKKRNRFLAGVDVDKVETIEFGKRILHVFEEACRVHQFSQLLADEKMEVGKKVDQLGEILNQGQNSLQHLFESSVERVDQVVDLCKKSGALGSRMTGAGWGGFVVSIVHERQAREFVEAVTAELGENNMFEVEPWSGATIFAIHDKAKAAEGSAAKDTR